jgi:hypothetical protein
VQARAGAAAAGAVVTAVVTAARSAVVANVVSSLRSIGPQNAKARFTLGVRESAEGESVLAC